MMTAKTALNLLKSEGVVYGVAGKATYVAQLDRLIRLIPHRYWEQKRRTYLHEAERAGLTPSAQHHTTVIPASDVVARRLDISVGDTVVQTTYRIFADNRPVSMSTSWEPFAITGGTTIELPHEGPHAESGLNARFASIGWAVEQVEERMVVRQPDPAEVNELIIPEGVAVVQVQQTVRGCQEGQDDLVPLEAADIVFVSDRYEFRYLMDRPK
nr:Transcriptional regulator, GntR family [Kibdelosporangium sp. MJ126-NF4]